MEKLKQDKENRHNGENSEMVQNGLHDLNPVSLCECVHSLLAERMGGIATRRGAFCAHPYVWRLMGIPDEQLDAFEECTDVNTPGMIRVSFGIYNTEEEVDQLLALLPEAIKAAQETAQHYSRAEPAY